jgi:hypothetical protein
VAPEDIEAKRTVAINNIKNFRITNIISYPGGESLHHLGRRDKRAEEGIRSERGQEGFFQTAF